MPDQAAPQFAPVHGVTQILTNLCQTPTDQRHMQERAELAADIPAHLHPQAAASLRHRLGDKRLWQHQAEALALALDGRPVVVSTSTASGKSTIFQYAAAHRLLSEPNVKVLALYPTKALVDDQLASWRAVLQPMGKRVAHVHGGVNTHKRAQILKDHDVIVATPDVVHAWFLRVPEARPFLNKLRLLVLDEAHAYDGAFGSNMAYMLRRLRAQSGVDQIVATTATLANPADYLRELTGFEFAHVGPDREGTRSPGRMFMHLEPSGDDDFGLKVKVLQQLAARPDLRFLAFADSRIAVGRLVAAISRDGQEHAAELVLPYRAGYEEADRVAIQDALRTGGLRGVVTTSALELGIDIGDIDVVVLLGVPQTMRSLWQRAGRAGRGGRVGVCLLFDDGTVAARGGLAALLDRPIEPSHLYLHNPLIQMGHAVCAASEIRCHGAGFDRRKLHGLPQAFLDMLDNELDPKAAVDDDVMVLRARLLANNAPQLGLPLRSAGEVDYRVVRGANDEQGLGRLSLSQVLREGYPGAAYFYIRDNYRVVHINNQAFTIQVERSHRHRQTQPLTRSKIFQRHLAAPDHVRVSPSLTVIDGPAQVWECVYGMRERMGGEWVNHEYKIGSAIAQHPLHRNFNTTGVGWASPVAPGSAAATELIRRAFCALHGVALGDVGCGPWQPHEGQRLPAGWCLYDAAAGSLRLTAPLQSSFAAVVDLALHYARGGIDGLETADAVADLEFLAELASALPQASAAGSWPCATANVGSTGASDGAVRVLAPGQQCLVSDGALSREVKLLGYRFGPQGLLYQLQNGGPATWWVPAARVTATDAAAAWLRLDPLTGEVLDEGSPLAP